MTEALEKAIAAVRQMPPAEQDDIAEAMLSLARIGEPAMLDPGELRDVKEGLAEIDQGDVASPQEVAAMWRSFER